MPEEPRRHPRVPNEKKKQNIFVNPTKVVQPPSNSDVPRAQIDQRFEEIPVAPFPKSGRWAYEQLKVANSAQAAAITRANERLAATPNARLLTTTTDIEQKMTNSHKFTGAFIQAFSSQDTFESLKSRYGTQCGELTTFLSRYYPHGLPTEAQINSQIESQPAPSGKEPQPSVQKERFQAEPQPGVRIASPSDAQHEIETDSHVESAPVPVVPAIAKSVADLIAASDARSAEGSDKGSESGEDADFNFDSDDDYSDIDPDIDPKDLESAKHSSDWWTRENAVYLIVKTTFSKEFLDDFKQEGEDYVIDTYPDEGARFLQLLKEFRIRDEI